MRILDPEQLEEHLEVLLEALRAGLIPAPGSSPIGSLLQMLPDLFLYIANAIEAEAKRDVSYNPVPGGFQPSPYGANPTMKWIRIRGKKFPKVVAQRFRVWAKSVVFLLQDNLKEFFKANPILVERDSIPSLRKKEKEQLASILVKDEESFTKRDENFSNRRGDPHEFKGENPLYRVKGPGPHSRTSQEKFNVWAYWRRQRKRSFQG